MALNDAIKTASNFADKVGSRTSMILLSVLAPGFLIVSEIVTWYYLKEFGTELSTLTQSLDIIAHNFLFSTLVILFVLALSFAFGFLSRELAFFTSDFLLRRQRPGRAMEAIKFKYGGDKGNMVDTILNAYPVFLLCTKEEQLKDYSKRRSDFYMRNFCKLWLRVRAADLSIENMEIEINIFLGLVLPTAGFALPFIGLHWTDWTAARVWFPLVSVAAAVLMMWKINDARRYETEQAVVHFLFAHLHWEKPVTIDMTFREEGNRAQATPGYSRRRSIRLPLFGNSIKPEG
jgi:hypothetical protein